MFQSGLGWMPSSSEFWLAAAALAAAAAASLALLLLPVYGESTDGGPEQSRRLVDGNSGGAIVLVVPVGLVAIAVLASFRQRRRLWLTSVVSLAVFSALTGFTIGPFYLPALGLLLLSRRRGRRWSSG
jgi:hypothetical protein